MSIRLSRRNFLKLGLASLGALAFNPYLQEPQISSSDNIKLVRIASKDTISNSIHSQPDEHSQILYPRDRDDVVNVYYEVVSDKDPKNNSIWYRVWGGYLHSSHTQPVEYRLNPVLSYIPNKKQLAEVSVPFTKSMTYNSKDGWKPLYTLYYQSTHWITDVTDGPDGEPWYKIVDEVDGKYIYYAPAAHFRPITAEELAPISPEIDQWTKHIEVSISTQTLTAYEGQKVVMKTNISSGMLTSSTLWKISTKTPSGTHNIESKMPSKHMGNGFMTDDPDAYELPGVPWCCFFVMDIGVAIHGTYWHTNFGNPMSHGCVNMRSEEAKWIYRWTIPLATIDEREKRGYGNVVKVI